MTRSRVGQLLIALLAAIGAAPVGAEQANAPARYTLSATVQPQVSSVDDRYRLRVELSVTPAHDSVDGRYRLKATNLPDAGCSALTDLFANGFEGS